MTKQHTPVQQVAQPEPIVTLFSGTVAYVKNHKQSVLTAAGILILAVVLGYVYHAHVKSVQEKSWAAYYTAQRAVQNDPSQVTALDGVVVQFPGSLAAQYAQLLKGDILYAQENYAQAIDVYEPLLNAANETLRTDAVLSLGAAKQAAKDYDGSIKVLSKFIQDNPKSFALPQAYLTLAMSQELAGKKQDAVETYQLILADYTKTYFGKMAKDKLATLNK